MLSCRVDPWIGIGESETRLRPEHVREPCFLVHHMPSTGQPGFAGHLGSHLPPGTVPLVHSTEFPIPVPMHHPAGTYAAHQVRDLPLGFRSPPVLAPVLEDQFVVESHVIRPAIPTWLPYNDPLEVGLVIASRERRWRLLPPTPCHTLSGL